MFKEVNNREEKGLKLKQIRESKGISLDTVHEATKIPMDALKAIEEGYTVRTMSSFYYRGFVKIYAQYLDIDLKEILDDYEPEKMPKHITKTSDDRIRINFGVLLTPKVKYWILRGLIACFVIFLLVQIGSCLKKFSKRRTTKKAQSRIEKRKATPKERATPPKQKATTAPAQKKEIVEQAQSATKEGRKANIQLTVRAKKDTWLQVKTDGNIVFQSAFKRGIVEVWRADKEIEISGRNIHQLEFELNGKLIGPIGSRHRRAKKVVITKNGFSVKQ